MFDYAQLVLRNRVYVSPSAQEKIRSARLLIAGCGMGSYLAEMAVRVGFRDITLVDGDSVEVHNLNRQTYVAADVGHPKVKGLAARLRAINPDARIRDLACWVDETNAEQLVAESDIVFDTIDFLSLTGLVALHDACRRLRKPTLSALNIGWGAGLLYFPPGGTCSFRRLFGLPETGLPASASYAAYFEPVVRRMARHLNPRVTVALGEVMKLMAENRPCPAPQVSGGAAAVAALGMTAVVKILEGEPIRVAPEMILLDLDAFCNAPGVDLLRD